MSNQITMTTKTSFESDSDAYIEDEDDFYYEIEGLLPILKTIVFDGYVQCVLEQADMQSFMSLFFEPNKKYGIRWSSATSFQKWCFAHDNILRECYKQFSRRARSI